MNDPRTDVLFRPGTSKNRLILPYVVRVDEISGYGKL